VIGVAGVQGFNTVKPGSERSTQVVCPSLARPPEVVRHPSISAAIFAVTRSSSSYHSVGLGRLDFSGSPTATLVESNGKTRQEQKTSSGKDWQSETKGQSKVCICAENGRQKNEVDK
jgi:hypothetical protein